MGNNKRNKLVQMWLDSDICDEINQFCKEYGFKNRSSMIRVAVKTYMNHVKAHKINDIDRSDAPSEEASVD